MRTIFPGATEGQALTFSVSVSVGNVGNGQNPSRGYIDNITFVPAAVATVRNGMGLNAMRYTSSPAILGGQWNVTVNTAGLVNPQRIQLVGTLRPTTGVMRVAGEVLVSGTRVFTEAWNIENEIEQRSFSLPVDAALVGRTLNTQVILSGATTVFCNAYDLVLGF